MILLGLTGGIGMGKSTTAGFLERKGIPVVDTDQLARQLVQPGEPALEEIIQTFGPGLVDEKGQLKRDMLASIVFANPADRQSLEQILHPRIRHEWRNYVQKWQQEERLAGTVVIPLLFETGAENEFDAVICTACTNAAQQERLADRGWKPEQIDQRRNAQLPVEKKIAKADFVVWSEGPLELHQLQVDRILRSLDIG